MNKFWMLFSSVFFLAACSSPPKPPTVNGSQRQPINDATTAEMLALRAELAAAQEKLGMQAVPSVSPVVPPPPTSHTVSVYFPYNDTKFQPTQEQTENLRVLLKNNVQRIWVRGRTDGNSPSAADERIALERAVAAKIWLIEQGVSPLKISVNYVSAGDYVADNLSDTGRERNRRVDIEIFSHQEGEKI